VTVNRASAGSPNLGAREALANQVAAGLTAGAAMMACALALVVRKR
jgi:hypothetical protein